MPALPVPACWLYGERRGERFPDPLHIETIVSRSSLHGWSIQAHRHQGLFQFFLIAAGGGLTRIDGAEAELEPGCAILLPPMAIHEFRFTPGTDGFVASVPDATLHALFEDVAGARTALARPLLLRDTAEGGESRALAALMTGAFAEFAGHEGGRAVALAAHATLVALWFARAAGRRRLARTDRSDPATALVRRFVEQVELRFRERHLLDAYAGELGVSTPHLSRVCRAVTGQPATRILQERLMIEARRDLVYTAMSVSQIAFRLGFSDPAYFSRFFTLRAGLSPSAYRRSR
jgi:AraC family transcriptional activator of pobA